LATQARAILACNCPGSNPGVEHGAVLRAQGRPKGPEEKSSLKHVVASLSKVIGLQVREAMVLLTGIRLQS